VLDDLLIEGDETIDLNIAVTGPGSLRSAQSRATVTIVDDDFAGFTLSEQQVNLSDAVTTGTFTAVLDAQPTGTVLLRVVSSDGSAVVADVDALTFDAENWNTPQTVTVTGVGDVGALAGTAIIVAVDATATTTDVFDSVGAQTVSIVLEGQDDGGQDDGEEDNEDDEDSVTVDGDEIDTVEDALAGVDRLPATGESSWWRDFVAVVVTLLVMATAGTAAASLKS
ncbi:MAG: hypothetical protein AAF787_06620, partial [Chloroflexota bacterium]